MSPVLSILASGVLVVLGVWLFGGILLRSGGVLLAIGGLLDTVATGSLAMITVSVLGVLAWLVGHWLFAVRHHYYRSPLARRVFNDALPALNPARHWGIPNVPPQRRR